MNVCISIMKDLSLYYTECNCYECLYEYCEGSIVVLYKILNCYEYLYRYYEGFIVVLYWMLIVMNGCMSNTKGQLLCYTEC
jgi:hypothetical protein